MKAIRSILAALLLLCLLHMPYGYYPLIRWAVLVCFAYFAYDYYKKKQMSLSFAFFDLAVLFQPLVKIALGRTLWNILDVAVAIFLVVLTFIEKPKPVDK